MIKGIIFDYNGTLVNDIPLHIKAYQKALQKHGVNVSREEIVSEFGTTTYSIMKKIFKRHNVTGNPNEAAKDKERIYIETVKKRNILFSDAEETVKELKKKFKLAILTGTTRVQILAPKKFLDLFDEIVAGDEVVKPKPFPDTLLEIAKKLGLRKEECCYVGDMPRDMKTAKNAGMLAIGLENEVFSGKQLKAAGANILINNLKELISLKVLTEEKS